MSAESDLRDHLPPQNQEAERCVLGSMLRNNHAIDEVLQILRKEDFYTDGHQKVFETIVALNDKGGQPVDVVILAENLKQREWLADTGGPAYLLQLWEGVPSAANVEYYARIVREKALLRNLILTGNEVLSEAYKQTMPADQLIETAQRMIFDLAEKGMTSHLTTLQKAIEETYERIDKRTTGEEMAFSGLSTGFADLNELTAGLQKSELVIIAARPSVGKCLSADSEIALDDGSVVTIEEIYRRQQARLLTLGEDYRLAWAEPSAFVDDGHKPVYRVTTRLGRRVEATASHPFLTVNGWRPLSELSPGEQIAVPRVVPVFGTRSLRDCEVKLLAYLLGDGGLTDTTPEFTNSNPRVREDFIQAVREFGPLAIREENMTGPRTPTLCISADTEAATIARHAFAAIVRPLYEERFPTRVAFAEAVGTTASMLNHWWNATCAPPEDVLSRIATVLGCPLKELAPRGWAVLAGKNTLTMWLRELDLWGKGSHDKFIPDCVFRLPREQAAVFLNRLFATDGWATVLAEGNTQIGYCSVSERLIRQVQHLLLRFGIISSLRRREVKYQDTRRVAWQLDITDQKAIRAFAFEIGMFGKEEALEKVAEAASQKRYQTNRDLIPMAVWDHLDERRGQESWSSLARRAYGENGSLKVRRRCLSRSRLERLAEVLDDRELMKLATSDVYWDTIVTIEPLGAKQVYDLTIPDTHNFVANDICVHNTAFSLSLARNVIVNERAPVFFVSLEQSRVEIAERLLCSQGRVDSHRLRKGSLTAEDMERLIEAGGVLRGAKLFIDDTPAQGMLRISANARRLKRSSDIRLVIIDYLQLIEPENRRDPRQEQVAQISRRLKFLARELEIPVIALAQVNRASEDRQDHRPRLSDLRESGSIEQDADTVFMLHRPDRYEPGQHEGVIEVIIAKNRNGPVGEVTLAYIKQYLRYEDYKVGTPFEV